MENLPWKGSSQSGKGFQRSVVILTMSFPFLDLHFPILKRVVRWVKQSPTTPPFFLAWDLHFLVSPDVDLVFALAGSTTAICNAISLARLPASLGSASIPGAGIESDAQLINDRHTHTQIVQINNRHTDDLLTIYHVSLWGCHAAQRALSPSSGFPLHFWLFLPCGDKVNRSPPSIPLLSGDSKLLEDRGCSQPLLREQAFVSQCKLSGETPTLHKHKANTLF